MDMLRLAVLASCCFSAVALSDRNELFKKYSEIFPHGSRNAASHRWASYILERSHELTDRTLRDLFAGFCSVSGSPLDYKRPINRWNMTLPSVSGGLTSGMMYFCCWPCICDTMDFIGVDTKTVRTKDGDRKYFFTVIGNPCNKPAAIPKQAPDVNCQADQLVQGTYSDNGFVIIGMLFEPGVTDHSDASAQSKQMSEAKSHCDERSASGNQGGMGMIFREVAAITPISSPPLASASLHATPASKKTLRESKGSQEQRRQNITNAGRRNGGPHAFALLALLFGICFFC